MKTKLLAGLLLASALGMCATAIARADDDSASPPPHKFLVRSNSVISIGVSTTPHIQSEFRPGSGTGVTALEGWQSGETAIFGVLHFLSFTDYRTYKYDHFVTDPVTVIGGGGQTTVPSFKVQGFELESGGGIRVLPRVFVGLATIRRQETTGYPPVKGIGYALMFAPAPKDAVSPYGWVTYQPNMGGNYALPNGFQTTLSYRATRYRAGVLIASPGSRLALDVGFTGENLSNRTNAPSRVIDTSLTAGLAIHF